MRRRVTIVLAASLAACGPVGYVNAVTMRASSEVEAAKVAGADTTAAYEYTLAVEYLHKAREEAGYARYQTAIKLGKKASEMANEAWHIALTQASGAATAPASGWTRGTPSSGGANAKPAGFVPAGKGAE